jgi:ribosome maturation factor RimP
MLSDSLVEAVRSRLEPLGLDLADLRVGGTPHRPLVQVRIDWPPADPERRVTVDDCALASRTLEAWLDEGGPLGPRYQLEVSSPGFDRPVPAHRHWVRFVGRVVTVKLEGLGRVRARVVAVPDESTVVLHPEGREPMTQPLAAARDARLAVDW